MPGSVLVANAVMHRELTPLRVGRGSGKGCAERAAVVGVEHAGGVGTDDVLRLVTEPALDRRAHVGEDAVGVDERDDLLRVGEQRAPALLALAQRGLGTPTLRDVL